VSLEKARMYERQRREAEHANALLEFADTLLPLDSAEAVAEASVAAVLRLLDAPEASLWLQDERSGKARCIAHHGEAAGRKTEEAIATLQGIKGWIAVRPPENTPFHFDGARMMLLDDVVKRTSTALGRISSRSDL
jgi:K+-sensing histidine kinase KdpD